MRIRWIAIPAVLSLAITLPACGGDSSSKTTATSATAAGTPTTATTAATPTTASGAEGEVRAAVKTYIAAFGDADAAKVCGMLTTEARAKAKTNAGDCTVTLAAAFKQLGGKAKLKTLAEQFTVEKVTVKGDTAKVTSTLNPKEPVELRKVDGEWKLQNAAS